MHLKDCLKRVPPDMQQNLAQLKGIVVKMQQCLDEGARSELAFDTNLRRLEHDSDRILVDLTTLRAKQMTWYMR